MSLALAIITASLMAIFGFPYRTYAAWLSWNPSRALCGIAVYFLAAGGGGGLVGWLGGRFSGALAGQELWLRGLVFGLAGAAILRASFRVTQETDTRSKSKSLSAVEETVSALAVCLAWVTNMLNDGAEVGALKWFGALDDAELRYQSGHIKAHILSGPGSDKAKTPVLASYIAAVEDLGSETQNDRDDARTRLVTLCAAYAASEHMSKSRFPKRPSPRT